MAKNLIKLELFDVSDKNTAKLVSELSAYTSKYHISKHSFAKEEVEPEYPDGKMLTFEEALADLVGAYDFDERYETPDYVLAEYMAASLESYGKATRSRDI